jgi:hypothetical protein
VKSPLSEAPGIHIALCDGHHLMQIHEVTRIEDPDREFATGGTFVPG